MSVTFEVVVPTLRAPLRGRWLPTREATSAVLLLDHLTPEQTVAKALFTHLGLYLHAAGIASLHAFGRAANPAEHAIDVLGSIGYLRDHGVRHIVVVAGGICPPTSAWQAARAETLAGFLATLHQRGASPPALISALGELVTNIRDATDTIRAVAILGAAPTGGWSPLLLPKNAPRGMPTGRAHAIMRQAQTDPTSAGAPSSSRADHTTHATHATHATHETHSAGHPSPALLYLPLPREREATQAAHGTGAASMHDERSMVRLASQLYLWCRTWATGGQAATNGGADALATASTLAADAAG